MDDTFNPDERIKELGISLPPPLAIPPGVETPLVFIKIINKRVLVSGHGPQESDGSMTKKLGQVGSDLSLEEGIEEARKVAYAIMGTVQREIGELNRVKQWVKVLGMVNSAPGFTGQTPVINGFSKAVLEVFGNERGLCTRSAIGMAALPFGIPVEVEAELELY